MNKSQQLKERIVFCLIILLLIIFIVMYLFTNQNTILTLKKENQQLSLENTRLQFESDVINTNEAYQSSENSYYKWLNLDETADMLVEDSNGQFKKSWAMYLVNES